jgi:NitT/TauT family transport system substrate-binding protein
VIVVPDTERRLRMNQGDPTEARIYYLAHFVARELRLFDEAGVNVEFIWSPPGDHLAKSGQVPAVLEGEADLTIGGPMVTMRMQAEGTARLLNFCAAVHANPWYLVAREPQPGFRWTDLIGRTVVDMANITTATLCFRWLLRQHGIAEDQLTIVAGSGDEPRDLESFRARRGDYLLHSLHTLGPSVTRGELVPILDLATATGYVPWSAYIALPQTVRERRAEFAAFTRAIAGALRWVNAHTGGEVASLISAYYPAYPAAALGDAISRYQAVNLWPRDALIPREEFERFRTILIDVGWFQVPVPYEDQVEASLAREATKALAER